MESLAHFNLRAFNTLALDCIAREVFFLADAAKASFILRAIHQKYPDFFKNSSAKIAVLGQGSNVILPAIYEGIILLWRSQTIDANLPTLIQKIKPVEDDKHHKTHVILRVPANIVWHDWVMWSVENGFYGLENLALIPGLVGAAPIQNIGAYGVEVKDFIYQVHALNLRTGQREIFTQAQCQFAYRDSFFKRNPHYLIDYVDFCLVNANHSNHANHSNDLDFTYQVKTNYADIVMHFKKKLEEKKSPLSNFDNFLQNLHPCDLANAIIEIRQTKLPDYRHFPNVGSFFKNPTIDINLYQNLHAIYQEMPAYLQVAGGYKVPAAWLIEQCGWRGKSLDGVLMSTQHSLVLVNQRARVANQILTFANRIQTEIYEKFGIYLEIEPVCL